MADGLLWHAGAFAFSLWLAFLYVKQKMRLEELEGAVVVLLTWPAGDPPPAALLRRALRYCEEECLDVLGTRVALAPPGSADGANAVATLLASLRSVRLNSKGESARLPVEPIVGIAGSARSSDPASRVEWRAGAWHTSTKESSQ